MARRIQQPWKQPDIDTAYRYFQGEDDELYITETALERAGTSIKARPTKPPGTRSSTASLPNRVSSSNFRRGRAPQNTKARNLTSTGSTTGPTESAKQTGRGVGPDNDADASAAQVLTDANNGVVRNSRSRFRPLRVGDEVQFHRPSSEAERAAGTADDVVVTQVPVAEGVLIQVTKPMDPVLLGPDGTLRSTNVVRFLAIDVNPVTGDPEAHQHYYIDERNHVFSDVPRGYVLVEPGTTGNQREALATPQPALAPPPPPPPQRSTPRDKEPPPQKPLSTGKSPPRPSVQQVGYDGDPVTKRDRPTGWTPLRDPVDGTRVMWKGPNGQVKPTAPSSPGVNWLERTKESWQRPRDFPSSGNTLVKFYYTGPKSDGQVACYVDEWGRAYTDIPELGMTVHEQLPLENDGSPRNPVTRKPVGGWTPVVQGDQVFYHAPGATQPAQTAPWDVGVSFTEQRAPASSGRGRPPFVVEFWAYELSGDLRKFFIDRQSRVYADSGTATSIQQQAAETSDLSHTQHPPQPPQPPQQSQQLQQYPDIGDVWLGVVRQAVGAGKFKPVRTGDGRVRFQDLESKQWVDQVAKERGIAFCTSVPDDPPLFDSEGKRYSTSLARFRVIELDEWYNPRGSKYFYIDERNAVFDHIPEGYTLIPDWTAPTPPPASAPTGPEVEDNNNTTSPASRANLSIIGPITDNRRFIAPSVSLSWQDLRAVVRNSGRRRRAVPERETGKDKQAGFGFAGIAKSSNDYYHFVESTWRTPTRQYMFARKFNYGRK